MNPLATLAAMMLLCTVLPPSLSAHGVRHEVTAGGMVVAAAYDDGSPMAFCDVEVFAPGSPDESFLDGASDRNGYFAFVPDTNGVWRVAVDDGMGHRVEIELAVGESGWRSLAGAPPCVGRLSGGVVGISVIFGCFGVYAMYAGRVRRRNDRETKGA